VTAFGLPLRPIKHGTYACRWLLDGRTVALRRFRVA
jgi:hypothetical protein